MTHPKQASRERWAPWWAIVLTVATMIIPGGLLLQAIDQLQLAASRSYMWELAAAVGPFILVIALVLLLPPIAYLIFRTKWLFIVSMIFGVSLALIRIVLEFT